MALWGLTDTENSKPKYLKTSDKAKTVFVDLEESKSSSSRIRGINSPGWWLINEHTDSNGNVRYKNELLIPATRTAAVAGDTSADNITAEDFTIVLQPVSVTVDDSTDAVFVVKTSANIASVVWEVRKVSGSFLDVTGEGADYSIVTATDTSTLTVVSLGKDGYRLRAKVTSAGGVTFQSKTVDLTVTPTTP